LGFAGVGWLGESLLREVAGVAGVAAAAVQDSRVERAGEVAQQYGVPWFGADFDAFLSAPGVDAVVISTPNALHAPQALAAFAAGKHVLVQKPLALSGPDAETVVTTAERTGQLLFVDYSYRFLDTVHALRTAVNAPVRSIAAVFHNIYGPGADKPWFFDPAVSGGGALTDLGVHLLDLAFWLVAPGTFSLDSAGLQLDGQPVESAAHLQVMLDDVPVQVDVSWNAPLPRTEIGLDISLASGSVVRWRNVDGSFFHFRAERDGVVLVDRETTLRVDTLKAFARALERGVGPAVDTRVYHLLDLAYGRSAIRLLSDSA
jgi:predicted dehydrogenase